MKVQVIGGISRSLVNFRGPLLRAMANQGNEVFTCAGDEQPDITDTLKGWNVQFLPVHLSRAGMHPWEDLRTLSQLYRLMRQSQPDIVLSYTIKPVIWGGIAARLARVPDVYSLITGLGYAFVTGNGLRGRVAKLFATLLYRLSLKGSNRVFFQNPDDLAEFTKIGLVQKKQCLVVNGTGVDLVHYGLVALPSAPSFLMICRLLADKGVREFVQAARIVKVRYPEAKFRLAGSLDLNPSSVTRKELDQWIDEGVIDYLGMLEDVRPAFRDCSIYILPSFREGTPRSVLEAMSMGRPIITTNAPGCRETIELPSGHFLNKNSKEIAQGENGFLVPVKNVKKLALAMEKFLENPALIQKMGRRSREIAEEKYDVHKVNNLILQAMGLA